MKKIILGAALLLSGVIGFAGWMIACTNTVQPGAKSGVFSCVNNPDEFIITFIFIIMAVAGLIITIAEARKPN